MKAKEVHKLNDDEIKIDIQKMRKRLFELRTQEVTEKIQDTSQFGKIRKDVARLLTEASVRRHKNAVAATAKKPAKKTAKKTVKRTVKK